MAKRTNRQFFKKYRVLKYILLALAIVFIWGQSALPKSVSSQESLAVTGWIASVLSFFFGKEIVTHAFVRKLAHFTEYAVLGFLLLWCMPDRHKKQERKLARCGMSLNAGLIIAFLDETIQYFSGRSPEIKDVWIDLAGVVLGILVRALFEKILKENI